MSGLPKGVLRLGLTIRLLPEISTRWEGITLFSTVSILTGLHSDRGVETVDINSMNL